MVLGCLVGWLVGMTCCQTKYLVPRGLRLKVLPLSLHVHVCVVHMFICFSSDEEDEEEGEEDEGLGEEGEKPSGEEEETARDTPGADVSGLQCLLKDTYVHA